MPFGRLFCTFCGAKLEINEDTVKNRATAGESLTALRRVFVRLFSMAMVFGAIALFFWPMAPHGQAGTAAQAVSCQQRITQTRARVLNGMVFTEVFPEAEVNALLKERLAKVGDASSGAGFMLTGVNLVFGSKVVMVNATMSLWKLTISYEVEVEPSISAQGFQYAVKSVRIGHVPLPFAMDFFAGRALHVFSDMREEDDVLRKMKQLEVAQGQVRVSNQTR